ncbi:hypothetical protein ASC97_32215 [Rhizobium sp. Root1203]|uniref:hypothetical protein n=1 Tax=Rhizobium sp. Root1203 TaxID=1736427 RepID=UPI000710F742|nr:hypothetical protein [Rhizobium sp. Root1203]KQV12689.1 hypothetical protein ASC97_32215 [Rhizobium sp. Root1203]
MSKNHGSASNGTEAARRGLWRLMLKLPAIRGELQVLVARSGRLNDLLEAYEEANATLERFLRDRGRNDCPLIAEYETVCAEIESDIVRYVVDTMKTHD